MKYVALLRGINVGGNRKVPMSDLKTCFETIGYTEVKTYINSGNVIFSSSKKNIEVLKTELEERIEATFGFKVEVLVLSSVVITEAVRSKPSGFGSQPDMYHSDVVFLLSGEPKEVVKVFQPNPEVDAVWAGRDVIYHTRLSEKLTKSRLSKIIASPAYKQMTIRSWNTVVKLFHLLEGA